MKDEELFELCEQVYEKTGWTPTSYTPPDDTKSVLSQHPLYNSDYLLEKLPPVIQDSYDKKFRHIQMWVNGDGTTHATYVEPYDKEFRGAYGDNTSNKMVKTLLKLTLALHKAGEL